MISRAIYRMIYQMIDQHVEACQVEMHPSFATLSERDSLLLGLPWPCWSSFGRSIFARLPVRILIDRFLAPPDPTSRRGRPLASV